MKKKIGDLTLNEIKKIMDECSNVKHCHDCEREKPLTHQLCALYIDTSSIKEGLDQEIEVEEDEHTPSK